MNKKINKNDYIKQLSKYMFWDVIIDKLDYKQDKQYIIERIAVYGNENDEKIMNILYPLRTIKKCLLKSVSINEKAMRYYAFVFHINEKRFKYYSRRNFQMPI